ALESAAQQLQEAAQAIRDQDSPQAAQAAESGLQAMQAAQAALEQAQASQAAQSGANAEQAAEQKQLAEQLAQAEAQAKQADLPKPTQSALESAMQKAQQAMQKAAQSLSQPGGSSQAAKAQREASEALQEAAEQASQAGTPQTPEQQEQAQSLAQKQKALKAKLLELARQAEARESQRGQKSLEQASQSASEAAEDIDSSSSEPQGGELDQAQSKQEETEKKIQEALDDLTQEEEQYKTLRQEELLFKISEELAELLKGHREAIEATQTLDEKRGDGPPSRPIRLGLRSIARSEEALASHAGRIAEGLASEGVVVFHEIMNNAAEDLARIARDLGRDGGFQSGLTLQARQDDVERSLVWLQEALTEEMQRRQDEDQEQQKQQDQKNQDQNPPPQPLVPDVAELKVLKRLEAEVLSKLEQTLEIHPELRDPDRVQDPLILEDLVRLAYKHQRVVELFRRFRERLGVPAPDESAD
ncbi:MAG TPA: hypothetical protein P5218_11890, partial [Planctomycetota bacterium]|nr:hypothetical protein [Planctomycetota bacterium]